MGSSLPNLEAVRPEEQEAPPSSRRAPGFGEVDLDAMGSAGAAYERPRPFVPKDRPKIRPSPNETPTRPRGLEAMRPTHRLGDVPKDRPTQQSLEAVKLAEQESQIARARLGKTTPPPAARKSDPATKIVSRQGEVDIDPFAPEQEDPIAAMRALYAQGNAEAALALANAITSELDEPSAVDAAASGTFRPGAPVEPAPFSDAMLDNAFDGVVPPDDPFGGLIPVDDDEELVATEPEELGDLDFGLGEDPFGDLVSAEPEPISHSAILAAGNRATGNLPIIAVQTPRLLIEAREISTLPIDPRGAFMLTLVDGIQSLEEILDTCAMPQAEALDLIDKLRLMGVIEV